MKLYFEKNKIYLQKKGWYQICRTTVTDRKRITNRKSAE